MPWSHLILSCGVLLSQGMLQIEPQRPTGVAMSRGLLVHIGQ